MLNYLETDKDISELSWFKTPVKTRYFFELKTENDIKQLTQIIAFSRDNNIKIDIVWWWSNILFWCDYYDGIIIKNSLIWYEIFDNYLESYSWENLSIIVNNLINNYSKNHFAAWIWLPWTIWWALVWNAGCFWLEMKDMFISAKILDFKTGEIKEIVYDEMKFEYRDTYYNKRNDFFLISLKISLDSDLVVDRNIVIEARKKQPKWFGWWCFFKNPKNNFAGKLIEDSGFKWFKLWGAYVSDKHANFILAEKWANWEDIINLKNQVQKTVFNKYNILLEEEVKIIN